MDAKRTQHSYGVSGKATTAIDEQQLDIDRRKATSETEEAQSIGATRRPEPKKRTAREEAEQGQRGGQAGEEHQAGGDEEESVRTQREVKVLGTKDPERESIG